MRIAVILAAACLAATAAGAAAQEPILNTLEIAVACAPPPTLDGAPATAPRVLGMQDALPRELVGNRDLAVIDGGTRAGLQIGQQFFVRRPNRLSGRVAHIAGTAHTAGWIRIVAANETTALAMVVHACDFIMAGDYLEPFTAPAVPAGADRNEPAGEPNFTAMARVLVGNEDRAIAGIGDFVLIDRGSGEGVAPGTRFAVYRDVTTAGMPLASVGEAIVISTGPRASLSRITSARDAIMHGDYVAFRK